MAKKRNQSLGGQSLPLGFGDFFFDSNDSLHPGSPDAGPYTAAAILRGRSAD